MTRIPRPHSTPKRLVGATVLALLATAVPMGLAAPASADTFTVTTTEDGVPGSLRDAIDQANLTPGADTIVLAPDADYFLDDAAGPLVADTGALTIEGNGSSIIQLLAGERVLVKDDATDLVLRGVSVLGGSTLNDGGGIYAAGNVVLEESTVEANLSGSNGGGIYTEGDLSLSSSTIAFNSAGGVGGGAAAEGNIFAVNSTVDRNDAGDAGGGLASELMIQLDYVTITQNDAPAGANLYAGSIDSFASVIAEAFGGPNCAMGATVSGGYNFSDDASCGLADVTDRENAGSPLLNPLGFEPQDPVGSTPVRLPDGGSPLTNMIPTGTAGCAGNDQRGVPRPQGPGCEPGAVEIRQIVATPGSYATPPGVPIDIDLTLLVIDPDNQWFGGTTQIFWTSNIGDAVLIDEAGGVRYSPASGFQGPAVIDYTACSDLDLICSSSTLTIQVGTTPPGPTPVAPRFAG